MFELSFRTEVGKLEAEFQHGIAVDIVRSGRIGGKKRYFRNSDGTIKSRKQEVWARVKRIYPKKKKMITPAIPQEADVEDTCRTKADKDLQIEHLQYRYHICRDLHSGNPLTGEARKEWERGRTARQD